MERLKGWGVKRGGYRDRVGGWRDRKGWVERQRR